MKKKLFLQIFRLTGWPRKLQFHATDEQELKDIKSFFPTANVKMAPNIPNVDNSSLSFPVKQKDELKAIFVSRIHPKKNLHFLLELFRELKPAQKLTFDIYGVFDDEAYTSQCKKLASALPDNILINFHGPLASRDVLVTLKKSHVFMLPTLGENFGHAIFESLTAGRPVLISDQTPWRDLTVAKAGWDLPVANKQAYSNVIEQLLNMEQEEFNVWANGAKNHSVEYLAKQDYFSTYSKLFNE
ncbi:glycosyltransferase [Pseudobacter ginsenosidimutans]|uniref:glycosyltransferase n=1 Tax=Pseudobacter ginsenosidimutans TaxID=661488 RepID=UPI00131570C3|nr:glycosyltransferase [Pseudobacter ginsenosidimutans]